MAKRPGEARHPLPFQVVQGEAWTGRELGYVHDLHRKLLHQRVAVWGDSGALLEENRTKFERRWEKLGKTTFTTPWAEKELIRRNKEQLGETLNSERATWLLTIGVAGSSTTGPGTTSLGPTSTGTTGSAQLAEGQLFYKQLIHGHLVQEYRDISAVTSAKQIISIFNILLLAGLLYKALSPIKLNIYLICSLCEMDIIYLPPLANLPSLSSKPDCAKQQ